MCDTSCLPSDMVEEVYSADSFPRCHYGEHGVPCFTTAFREQIALLLAMIANIQCGLHTWVKAFYKVTPMPNPRIKRTYTYLMAWCVMHCSSLMSTIPSCQELLCTRSSLRGASGIVHTCTSSGRRCIRRPTTTFTDVIRSSRMQPTVTYLKKLHVKIGTLPFRQ